MVAKLVAIDANYNDNEYQLQQYWCDSVAKRVMSKQANQIIAALKPVETGRVVKDVCLDAGYFSSHELQMEC